MFIWRHDLAFGLDVIYSTLGKEFAYAYHPNGEANEIHCRRFMNYLLAEMLIVFPENPVPPVELDGEQKRHQEIKKIMIEFMKLELGRNLTGQERACANQAQRIEHPNNWVKDYNWNKWLSGPVAGRVFYDGVVT